jgi:hypothetical protein
MPRSSARLLQSLLVATLGLLGPSCSGSSSTGDPAVTLAVTDAASDDLVSFLVQLKSFRLQRDSGGYASILPDPVGVNFADLADLARVLNVTSIPLGVYTVAEVTLNFTSASAVLTDHTGEAALVDGDGVPLAGDVVVPIQLATPLTIERGNNYLLELDFDLDQSVLVDSGANVVTVEPSLVLRIDPPPTHGLAIGGTLKSIDSAAGTFRIGLPAAPGDPIPLITVAVESATVFQLDGQASQGSAGLAALEGATALGEWVQAFGTVSPGSALFLASTVESGVGSYNGGSDIIDGHITGRVGNQLTVLGHSNDSSHTTFQYNRSFTVDVSVDTRVLRRGSTQTYDLDDLNVGQGVRIFGVQVTNASMDASTTQDVVRIQPARLLGFVASPAAGGQLSVDLSRVDLRFENQFTWTDDGGTPADPSALVVDLGSLDATGIGGGMSPTPVAVTGFFTATDVAASDFTAVAIENRALASSLVVIHDRAAGLNVQPTFASDSIAFSITGSVTTGELLLVDQGFVGATPLPTSPTPMVEARILSGQGFYTVRDRTTGAVSTYLTFAGFSNGLNQALLGGAVLYNVSAVGLYDSGTNTVGCALVGVVVE